jgi:hypothetical protein
MTIVDLVHQALPLAAAFPANAFDGIPFLLIINPFGLISNA